MYPRKIDITVKNSVIKRFLPAELGTPTNGKIINVLPRDITKPTAVFVMASSKECFLVCVILIYVFINW